MAPREGDDLRRWLSEDELARAAGFHFDEHRNRFIVSHAATREILGRKLGLDPRAIRFTRGPFGKPEITGETDLRFNLAHSGDLALLAMASGRAVGVDVEALDRTGDQTQLARRWFSAEEFAAIERLPEQQRGSAFLHAWVCKEAWLKAIGSGLSRPLDSFDVSVEPGKPARLLATRPDPAEAAAWSLSMLDPGGGYIAALAVEGPMPSVGKLDWNPHE